MRNSFNKARILPLAAILTFGVSSSLFVTSPAEARTVYCSNCSTVFSQATQVAKEIETAISTAESLRTQIQQYEDMVTQGVSFESSLFGRITDDIQRVQQLYNDGKALAGRMSNFDERFKNQFGDYRNFLKSSGSTNDMQENYERWADEGLDSMRVAMKSAGMNVSAMADEDELLSEIVERSQNAEGRMQAIQAGNEIAAQQVQQMQKLRNLMNDQIQSQSLWYAQNVERQARDDAYRQNFNDQEIRHSSGAGY